MVSHDSGDFFFGYFMTDERERRLFVPQGIFGRLAYVIPDAQYEARLRRALLVFTVGLAPIGPAIGVYWAGWYRQLSTIATLFLLLALAVGVWAFTHLVFTPWTSSLERTRIRARPIERWSRCVRRAPLWTLLLATVIGAIFTALCSYGFWVYGDSIFLFSGLFLFVLCLAPGVAGMAIRFRRARDVS